MSFTNHFPGATRVPVITVGVDDSNGEAVFVTMHEDGTLQIVELDLVREWAELIYRGKGEARDFFQEMYVRLPGGKSLFPCVIRFAGSPDAPKMVVRSTSLTYGALMMVDL